MENEAAKNTQRTSRRFSVAQTSLLCAFAVAFFFDPSPRLIASAITGTIGGALCAIGLVLMLFALASIRRVIQIAPEPRPEGHLVTRGVYSRIRHPIYMAIVILVVGLFLRNPTVVVAIAAATVVVFLIVKARFEEQLLVSRYPEYAEYQRRTWGLVPWFFRARGRR